MPAKLFLKKNEDRRIKNGHLWVFSNEISKLDETAENGDIIEIYDSKNSFLGYSFYNKNSLISARMLGKDFKGDFYSYAKDKINSAYTLRKSFYPNRESFRLVFSESDYLPGLIIDKYNDSFVLQVYSFGMERNVQDIVNILKQYFRAKNIFTLNDNHFRKLEGLPENDEIYSGSIEEEIIEDAKIKYKVDFTGSQKTGFYFDQYDNREFIEKFVRGKTVLDAFCNSGGFGMHTAHEGAESITFVDSSAREIENSKSNYSLNGLTADAEFVEKDVFDYLEESAGQNKTFDVIILDPPSFAKSKKSLPSAIKGYTKLNKLALGLLTPGGFLATSSCSHHLKESDFLQAVNSAAVKANRSIQLLHFSGAALDHPRLPAMEETSYLKFTVFRAD
jgi:23S rRNA (cytosine1962-C5)-methyltransferase